MEKNLNGIVWNDSSGIPSNQNFKQKERKGYNCLNSNK